MNIPVQIVSFRHPEDEHRGVSAPTWIAYTTLVLPSPQTKTLGPYGRVSFFGQAEAIHATGPTRDEAIDRCAALVGDLLAHLPQAEVTTVAVTPKALLRPSLMPAREAVG